MVALIFTIYYKKIKIDWILCEFYEPTTSIIIDKIMKNTTTTKIISHGNLFCKSREDLEIIDRILFTEYKKRQDDANKLPNLFEETIKTLFY